MKKALFLLCAFMLFSFGNAQTKQNPEVPSPIIFIYDASGSMWGQIQGKTKMEIASEVLSTSINQLPENQKLGLIAYGHRKKGDCRDVETLVTMDNSSKGKVIAAISAIKPLGMTPLAYSATAVIDQLRKSKEKATIILITDGIESCDGNICDVVANAKKEGIDFKLHIVGFGLKSGETEQLKCAAKAGDGNYYDAADASGLGQAMDEVVTATIDKPEGNLGVFVLKDGKPLDAQVVAYAPNTENIVDRKRTYKDTAFLYLPQATYDLKVYQHDFGAVSALTIKNVKTFTDKTTYQTVSLDGAKLNFMITNNGELWDSQIGVKTLEGKNVIGGRTYAKPKMLDVDPGTYNIELYARTTNGHESTTSLENIKVGNGEVTEVQHDFKTGVAILGGTFGGDPFDVGINIVDAKSGKSVYGGRTYKKNKEIILSVGSYNVTLVEHGVYNASAKSSQFTIEIKQGETVTEIREVK
ncbi:vWA domain-containing protein [Ulvibacter antarcticus]|uniref:Ca-activated chloride channel family protein n=1 Tax=Ulvibacter antarcticus TaxID=442714 RepID=A0A3L9YLC2_9FLAO|nr:VWA domain-containing protein [Ulvibacter antarcticus]RMA58808.1 Ca-activated chloride channel family protein [Ulvibacter antarcticus]